jgi:hypothetical protein
MLIALVTVLFLGGGGGIDVFDKQHRRMVAEVVEDEAKASEVIDEMKAAQKGIDRKVKELGKVVNSWAKLDKDHASRLAELGPLQRETDELRRQGFEIFADSILTIRELVSREEWSAMVESSEDDD